jgi:outer membrane lipoprotein-sorting protein
MTNMRSFERFVRGAAIRTDETANERILKMMSNTYQQSVRPHAAHGRARWGIAAAILIVLIISATRMGSLGGGVAWGKVADHVAAIDTFMFSLAIDVSDANDVKPQGQPTARWVFYVSEQHGFRMDISGGGQTVSWYAKPEGDTVTMVIPAAKQWMKLPIPPEQRNKKPEQYEDPNEYLERFLARPQTKLGRSTIDGVEVEGIQVTDPPTNGQKLENAIGRLWVDTQTELPVRIEIEGKAGQTATRWQMDFKWGETVNPAVFEPNIPSDYKSVGQ